MSQSYAKKHIEETAEILQKLDYEVIDKMAESLAKVRAGGGRLFILGVGGGAGHASHAVNDFRKICGFEAYSPTDNVSELTARVNDDGWDSSFANILKGSRINEKDALLVFSVGGGNKEKNVSVNLVEALELAKSRGAKIFGVVGRDGGHVAKVAEYASIIPTVNPVNVTPHTEAFQAVVWHLLVSHPALKMSETKWESVK